MHTVDATRAAALPLLLALVALPGCGSEPPSATNGTRIPTDVADDELDPVPVPDTSVDDTDGDDTAPPADVATPDGADDPLDEPEPAGAACVEDADCASYLCIRLADEPPTGVCSAPCRRSDDCPEGFTCVDDPTAGTDGNRYCLPTDLCFDEDGDGWGIGPGCAGPDCDDADPDIYPGAIEVCDGRDNNCNDQVDENPDGVRVDCETGFDGRCAAGRTQCIDGLLDCIALQAPGEEICNGLDDDCDGLVDEGTDGEPLERPCWDGDEALRDVGLCVGGVQLCRDAEWSRCEGQTLPAVELCNGADDDCDGSIDEDVPTGDRCDSGLQGECADGRTTCADGELLCEPERAPRAELCNGLDDDCNGLVDDAEDGDPLRIACYSGSAATRGQGACRDGYQLCEGGTLLACTDQILPIAEVCNGVDDDCDGSVDEDVPGGQACSTGLDGACSAGARACSDGTWTCEPAVAPVAEVCNGIDDDCDGSVDEDVAAIACWPDGLAGEGVGICRTGTRTCADGAFGSCQGLVLPATEVCDGTDNDCDGSVDEGNPGGNQDCDSGELGICRAGRTRCDGGALVCDARETPRAEVCNGLDDNCDGAVDNAPGGGPLTDRCYTGPAATDGVGICSPGTRTCSDGAFRECVGQVLPGTEACNGLDDDCDGTVDEGCPTGISWVSLPASTTYGGTGGTLRTATLCAPGQALTGINVRYGSRVDAIQAVCSEVRLSASSPYTTTTHGTTTLTNWGGSGGTYAAFRCPSNSVIYRFDVRAAGEVDRVQPHCARLSYAGAPGAFVPQLSNFTAGGLYGGTGGNPSTYTCPSDGVVTGFQVRSGSRIDQIRFTCSRPDARMR